MNLNNLNSLIELFFYQADKQDEKSIKKDLEEIGINKNYDYYILHLHKDQKAQILI